RGLQLVARNFRCRSGELDLIMRSDDLLVVVEVRSRSHDRHLSPSDSIDRRKQVKIVRATEYFLARHAALAHLPVRLDVISITGDQIDWIPDAFTAEDCL
ncbi:MAG: YraN family protein, partial [Gammaproteobacteria bacterium]|nr:YraN family protein [Gammaproteobacteria bacterium]